jgi:hypothetical protein
MSETAFAYVTLIPVAKGFQGALAKELGGVEKLGDKAGKDFSKGFGQQADRLSTGIIAAFAAVAAGAGLLLKSAIGEASTLEESLNALSVAYGKNSDSIVKLGEDAASRLGVTQSAFNASAVRFSAFAERVVGAGGDVAGFVDSVTTRASDFASVFNIDVAEALQVFQSGLSGEAEPLKRFGINLLDTEVKAYAVEAGLIAVGGQMNEDIKTQARYGLLMQETAKTQGDFANTSDGLANSQRILSAEFTDMQATIGNALLPVMATLVSQVKDDLLPIVARFGDWLQSPEGINAVHEFGEAMSDALDFSVDFTTGLVDNLSVLIKLGGALLAASVGWKAYKVAIGLATTAQVAFNFAVLANPFVFAAAALVALVGAAILFRTETDNGLKSIETSNNQISVLSGEMDRLSTSYDQGAIDLQTYETQAAALRREMDKLTTSTQESSGELNRFANLQLAANLANYKDSSEARRTAEDLLAAAAVRDASPSSMGGAATPYDNTGDLLKKAIKDTREAYKEARADYNEIVADANKDFSERNNDILDSYTKSVNSANEAFTSRSADIVASYNDSIAKATDRRDTSMASALADYNQGIVDTNKKFADEQESIIQRSMDRLRSGFKSAVSVNVASIFDSDAIAGSVDGLVETLKDKLAGSKSLLDNAAKLTSAGFSQTFVEQVVGAGTELGNELANSVLNATPETVTELKALFGEIETTSETGMDKLAQTIYDKTGLATTALQGLYDQTFIDLAKSLTEQQTAYVSQQKEIQREFNISISEAEATRTEAMADANLALQESIADAAEYRDQALLDSQESLNDALLSSAESFEDNIKAIAKTFRQQVQDMQSAASGLAAQINGVRAALGAAQSQARDVANAAAAAIAKSKPTPRQPTFLAEGGLVTSATNAIVGEAGPEVVIPLDRFESMMGMSGGGKAVNYYAAPNQSIDSEQDLFQAMRRAKVVAGW